MRGIVGHYVLRNSGGEVLSRSWELASVVMRRLCERPGCAAPAEVSYGMDKANLLVWIDNTAIPEREHAGRLCRRHADALVVPRDWSIDDRRQEKPLLFRNLADDTSGMGRPKSKKTPARTKDITEKVLRPSLFEEIEAEVDKALQTHHGAPLPEPVSTEPVAPEVAPVDPEETKAIPWSPRLGAKAVPDDQPTPTFGRLLGRAFGQKKTEDD